MVVKGRQDFFPFVVQDRLDAEIDGTVGELIDDGAQAFGIGQVVHLLAKTELVDDILHILAVAVEILDEVHLEALGIDLGLELFHREARSVAEGIAGDLEEDRLLVGNVGRVQLRFALQDSILGGLQQDI